MVNSEWVDLNVDDGTTMRAWVARPDGPPPSRGLLVFQEAFGVNAHIRDVTERFANAGFLAIAPDLFHRTAPGFEGSYTDFPAAMPHLQAITVPGLEADVRAAYRMARSRRSRRQCCSSRVLLRRACRVRREHHRAAQSGGVVLRRTHPAAPRPGRASGRSDAVLLGRSRSPYSRGTAARGVKGVGDAGKPFVDVVFSDADHGFFCDARASYQPAAAAQAWSLTHAFLRHVLPALTIPS